MDITDLGLSPLFYHFHFAYKGSFIALLPLAGGIFYALRMLRLSVFYQILLLLLWLVFSGLILFSYDSYFGVFFASFFSLFALLALFDGLRLYVPAGLNFLSVLIAVFALFWTDLVLLRWIEAFALCGMLGFLQVSFRLFNKECLGDGDLVFALALGLVFGLSSALAILFLASLCGVIAYGVMRRRMLPMITLLFFGMILSFVIGVLYV